MSLYHSAREGVRHMKAYNVHMARPSDLTKIKRKAYMQDPVARVLLEACPMESPGFTRALVETINLRGYGIPITEELIRKVGEKFAKWNPVEHLDIPDEDLDVVYYARIGNRVKIGTTTNLRDRMMDINPEELLVVEPGGRDLERRRHYEFKHLNTHGEWFRYQGILVFHVKALVESASPAVVDTAALAAMLGCTPSYIRWLVSKGVLAPTGTTATATTGRPSLTFDADMSEVAVRHFRAALDLGDKQVRK